MLSKVFIIVLMIASLVACSTNRFQNNANVLKAHAKALHSKEIGQMDVFQKDGLCINKQIFRTTYLILSPGEHAGKLVYVDHVAKIGHSYATSNGNEVRINISQHLLENSAHSPEDIDLTDIIPLDTTQLEKLVVPNG